MSKKIRTPKEVFEYLSIKGLYEEAHFDKDEIKKIKNMALEDYEYGKKLKNMEYPNWRVIFNIHYDVIRELCNLLMRFKNQKISNHQGLFAFIVLNFKELKINWNFLEKIRNTRNENKYKGKNIPKETWGKVEHDIDVHIIAIKTFIENNL
jgi:hypothetical protein